MYTYDQRSGLFLKPGGAVLTTGYSGREGGRNNPLWNNVKDFGPAPRGFCKILQGVKHPKLGPVALQLVHLTEDGTFLKLLNGRSDFFIHGDNFMHDASHGCIILDLASRTYINANLTVDSYLEVM